MVRLKEVPKKKKTIGEKIDHIIGVISPKWGAHRMRYRAAMAGHAYRAARTDRLRSWMTSGGSADEDILWDLPMLREKSRELNRNDPHGSGITDTMETNIIGSGIRLQSRIDFEFLGMKEDSARDFQKAAERAWRSWVPYADASDHLDFDEIQQLCLRQILENGESFVLIHQDKTNARSPYALSLEVIESDRIETPPHLKSDKSVRSGIKIGPKGEPVAYFVRKTHPGDLTLRLNDPKRLEFLEIPAYNELGLKNIIHLYKMKRPGQTRGVPFFAPVMNYFKDTSDYFEAELIAAQVAACFAAVITKTDPLGEAYGNAGEINTANQRLENIEPGTFEYLQAGESIQQLNPNRPGGSFEPFMERILRAISSGLNLPYEVVAKDFSRTNYSSARAAILEARKLFLVWQSFIAKKLCDPVYDRLLEEAYLDGKLPIRSYYASRDEYKKARWIGQGWGWVDPVKEVKASKEALDSDMTTLADVCAASGLDWEEVLEQRAREKKKKEDLGLGTESQSNISDEDLTDVPEEEPARQRSDYVKGY